MGTRAHLPSQYVSARTDSQFRAQSRSENETEFLCAARRGDSYGFNGLWNLYSNRVYRVAFGIVRNSEDAEDAVQEAFFLAFRSIGKFEGRSSFYSWIVRIATNSSLGILRKRRRRREDLMEELIPSPDRDLNDYLGDLAPSPEELYGHREEREILLNAIEQLPCELKTVISVCVLRGGTVKDLASELSITRAAAKSRLHRARRRVAELIGSNVPQRSPSLPPVEAPTATAVSNV